jgi:seryl-tRNA(Sec) selenium transferase
MMAGLHSAADHCIRVTSHWACCSKIAEAEAAVSVNENMWLVMHMHVQLQLDELRGPQTLGSL